MGKSAQKHKIFKKKQKKIKKMFVDTKKCPNFAAFLKKNQLEIVL